MLKYQFIIAIRHLLKNKSYSILNIIGLSVGLACFTLIGSWIKTELSYDNFHRNADRLYRIGATRAHDQSLTDKQAVTPAALSPALISDFREVETALRVKKTNATVKLEDKQFIEDDILVTDPSFLTMFSFNLKAGDTRTALNDPYAIVLSENMARKYFGASDPMGKSISLFLYDPQGNGKDYTVTGVIEDCPLNSHVKYNFLVSFKTIEVNTRDYENWLDDKYYTYVLLNPDGEPSALERKFPAMVEKYSGNQRKELVSYFLQPLTSIHLHSQLKSEIQKNSNTSYILLFGTIGIIVLLLACMNYINLSTAFSSNRFKEAGVKKVMGALKKNLISQYITESWIIAVCSLLISFIWIELSRPLFESLTGKPVTGLYTIETLAVLVAITTLVGILSGFYPAFVLSSFKPANILKGQARTGNSGNWLRKGLVVTQYAITIILIIGILVIQSQLRFVDEKDLGFDQHKLIVIGVNGSREVISGFEGFANELRSKTVIKGVTRSNSSLANGLDNSAAVMEAPSGENVTITMNRLRTDHEFADVYKMNLAAGRFFQPGNPADSARGFIVNETSAKACGYQNPFDALGKSILFQGVKGEIIGVVKDFHYNSLQKHIEPVCLALLQRGFSRISIRLDDNSQETLNVVAGTWSKHFPNTVFDFRYAEEALDSQYKSEKQFSTIFLIFSGISLSIACLGLFALVSYTVEKRTKEIGIRKTFGASVHNILSMISTEFLILIAVACLIGMPVSFFLTQKWLQQFAYRIDLSFSFFIIASSIILLISIITISLRSFKAALTNPIKSLRNE